MQNGLINFLEQIKCTGVFTVLDVKDAHALTTSDRHLTHCSLFLLLTNLYLQNQAALDISQPHWQNCSNKEGSNYNADGLKMSQNDLEEVNMKTKLLAMT